MVRQASREIKRLAEGRFYVGCIGRFKRGKSTLKSVVTVVRYEPWLHARVRLANPAWQPIAPDALAAYVSEE